MNKLPELNNLSDAARLWVYAFDRPLSDNAKTIVRDRLTAFVAQWNAHRTPVQGAFTFLHDRFVVIAGESAGDISGCSIDSSVGNFKWLRDEHGLDGLNRNLIFYRDNEGTIIAVDRPGFQAELDAGRINADTPVFDTTLQSVGDMQSGLFEVPLLKCWHARAFKLPDPAEGTVG